MFYIKNTSKKNFNHFTRKNIAIIYAFNLHSVINNKFEITIYLIRRIPNIFIVGIFKYQYLLNMITSYITKRIKLRYIKIHTKVE